MVKAGLTAVMLVLAGPAAAATQGDAGSRSAGNLAIVASVAPRALVAGSSASPCVALNTATRGFDVTADPADPGMRMAACGERGRTNLSHAVPDGARALIVAPE